MNETDNDPRPDWAALGWITDRLPTCEDADGDGDVWMPRGICEPTSGRNTFVNYRAVVAVGQPWYSRYPRISQPASVFSKVMQSCGFSQANPAEPDRITELDQRVVELEATMRQLLHGSKFRLVVEPR